jgi:hypothetical protein
MPVLRVSILAMTLAVAGCGSSSETDKTAPFLGAWTIGTGAVTGTCPAPFNMVSQKLDGSVQTVAKGTDSDLVLTLITNCTLKMDVTGNVATIRTNPVQSCMLTFNAMGIPVMPTATFSGGSFTVSGTTASFTFTGTATAGPLSCMLTGNGALTKGASDAGAAVDALTAAND